MGRGRRSTDEDADGKPIEVAGMRIKQEVLLSLGGLVLGLILFSVGLVKCSASSALASKGLVVSGEVVAVRSTTRRRNKRRRTVYIPTIRFKDAKGTYHTCEGEDSSATISEGSKREVIYDPDKPEDARENSGKALWVTPIVLIVVGLAIVVFGCLTGWKAYNKRAPGRSRGP